MTLARGRVRGAEETGPIEALGPVAVRTDVPGRRLAHQIAAASERAATIIAAAERRAASILADAEARAVEAVTRAKADGRAEGLAEIVAHAIRLREREHRADVAGLDRTVELSRILAERLLGHVLETSPGEVASLARQALDEARGARRIRIHAHPEDAEILSRVTAELDPSGRVHAVLPDLTLPRGDLRLETDAGTVEARLGPSLAHLAARLREALRE